jgi:hypothetical protein
MDSVDIRRAIAARPTVQWEFIKHDNGWTWRKLFDDGRIAGASSRTYRDCDLAHLAAAAQGFRSRGHHWMITTEFGTTHFQFPRPPAFVPRREPARA